MGVVGRKKEHNQFFGKQTVKLSFKKIIIIGTVETDFLHTFMGEATDIFCWIIFDVFAAYFLACYSLGCVSRSYNVSWPPPVARTMQDLRNPSLLHSTLQQPARERCLQRRVLKRFGCKTFASLKTG